MAPAYPCTRTPPSPVGLNRKCECKNCITSFLLDPSRKSIVISADTNLFYRGFILGELNAFWTKQVERPSALRQTRAGLTELHTRCADFGVEIDTMLKNLVLRQRGAWKNWSEIVLDEPEQQLANNIEAYRSWVKTILTDRDRIFRMAGKGHSATNSSRSSQASARAVPGNTKAPTSTDTSPTSLSKTPADADDSLAAEMKRSRDVPPARQSLLPERSDKRDDNAEDATSIANSMNNLTFGGSSTEVGYAVDPERSNNPSDAFHAMYAYAKRKGAKIGLSGFSRQTRAPASSDIDSEQVAQMFEQAGYAVTLPSGHPQDYFSPFNSVPLSLQTSEKSPNHDPAASPFSPTPKSLYQSKRQESTAELESSPTSPGARRLQSALPHQGRSTELDYLVNPWA